MPFPSFTVLKFFGTLFFILSLFSIAKILTQGWRFHLKESLYLIIAAVLTSVISVANRDISNVFSHTLGDMSMLIALFFYFHKIKHYTAKKSLILTFVAAYINITMLFISTLVFYFALLDFGISHNPDFLPDFRGDMPILAILQVLSYFPFFAIPALMVTKFTQGVRRIINNNDRVQTVIACIGIIVLAVFHTTITLLRYQEYAEWLVSDSTIMVTIFSGSALAGFYFYTRYVNTKHERQQKEAELRSLQYYVTELEQQQTAIRKFKHDYQNILASMEAYMQDDDVTGLRQYFSTNIKPVSETITKSNLTFQGLDKIKVREIKSIIATKIVLAQSVDADIDIKFEANEDIEHIPLDSVALVRMLGIILDNAIEALTELGGGKLFISVHRWSGGITFTVQNTCGDMPPEYQVLKPGYSTKGKNRGLGLSNLLEIVDANPNVILETKIENGSFTQQLLIT